MVMSDLIAIIK